jgi:hypothetical protein
MGANANRYYPSPTKTGALHEDFRKLFDHVYSLQDQLTAAHGKLAEMESRHGKLSQQVANGPSTTKIQGLPIKGVPPMNGQALKWNAATGEIEWT